MRKTTNMSRTRRLRSNNQRRVLLKKLHQKVLLRRKQFDATELNQEFQKA
ncbi:hypothetical protein GPUN_1437 [Glaciecola punicea ACAM 611]|jgi:hypothetical protein|uniref:Uncharacterized protein n=1 Tax=Glaciecola punicea ACAM 611 TaxID=1121923 RepID=H5TB84_9ALTE|nr:hypothetical protein [Glaciecola punicea]GAB55561.1 hypothetical protein GPUN_1437 [Glaciecola punicea ACAM 611]